jgi:hypothetical protein
MAITIGDDGTMTGGSGHTARWSAAAAANEQGAWICDLPALRLRLLTREEAVAGLTLGELEKAGRGGSPAAAGLRAELGI